MNIINNSFKDKPFSSISRETESTVSPTRANSSKNLSASVLTRIITIIKDVSYQGVDFISSSISNIKQAKEAQTHPDQAESTLVYIQQIKLRNWAEINIHYTTSFTELIEHHPALFNNDEMNALKGHLVNYYDYFDSVRKTIENIHTPQQVTEYVELFFEQTKNLQDQLRKIYLNLPASLGKRALFDLTKAFTTAINKQQAVFRTPPLIPIYIIYQSVRKKLKSHGDLFS